MNVPADRLAVKVSEYHPFRRYNRQIAIGQEEQIVGVVQNRGNISSDKVLVLAKSDHRGRAIARGHDLVGFINRNHGQGEHAAQFLNCLPHSFFEGRVMAVPGFQEIFFNQVGDDFGVGVGRKLVSFFNQLLVQENVVLDDAVVHHDHADGAITMRVSVYLGGALGGGPAGGTDAIGAVDGLQTDHFFH